jgi:hypothetical protein
MTPKATGSFDEIIAREIADEAKLLANAERRKKPSARKAAVVIVAISASLLIVKYFPHWVATADQQVQNHIGHDNYDRAKIAAVADDLKAKGRVIQYEFSLRELNVQIAAPHYDAQELAHLREIYMSPELFEARGVAIKLCVESGRLYGVWQVNVTFNGELRAQCTAPNDIVNLDLR